MRLLPEELFRLALFFGAVLTVYVLAVVFAVRWLREFRAGAAISHSRGFLRFRRVIFFLAGLGTVCVAYGLLIEPYWLEVTHVHLASPKLAGASRPIRILFFADLHSDPAPRLEEKLPDVAASLHPDVILFAGDAVNSPESLPIFQRCFTRLAQVAPTFAVRGNWDTWDADFWGGTGAKELNGESVRVPLSGTEIWIAGVSYENESTIPTALDQIPRGRLAILLYHTPDEVAQATAHHADLYLAGHTHGGQVALPFYGALITLSRYGKKYEAGLYQVGATALYVNRGVGLDGGPLPRVRFFARPELTLIEVSPPPAGR